MGVRFTKWGSHYINDDELRVHCRHFPHYRFRSNSCDQRLQNILWYESIWISLSIILLMDIWIGYRFVFLLLLFLPVKTIVTVNTMWILLWLIKFIHENQNAKSKASSHLILFIVQEFKICTLNWFLTKCTKVFSHHQHSYRKGCLLYFKRHIYFLFLSLKYK